MRYYFALAVVVVFLLIPGFIANFPQLAHDIASTVDRVGSQLAAVILSHKPVTVEQLRATYDGAGTSGGRKVRILVVPGHEPDFGGAEGYGLKERELNVELARSLISFLNQNGHYEVFTTRDDTAWTPEFAQYFKSGWNDIVEWTAAHKQEVASMTKVGDYKRSEPIIYHAKARPDVGYRLHGINKWVGENNIDVVVHIHFNDYPGHGSGPGAYSGFAIYVPERQYYNSTTTKAVAGTLFKRLSAYNAVSNLNGEDRGIVEEQDLIAVGANNSVDAASLLIEYGYLYEPQLQNAEVRHLTLREMAYETYLGLLDFFDPEAAGREAHVFDTLILPHEWKDNLDGNKDSVADIFALQTALVLDGDFPAKGYTAHDCPRSGKIGPCTKAAIAQFQDKYAIHDERGMAGAATLAVLNKIFSAKSR